MKRLLLNLRMIKMRAWTELRWTIAEWHRRDGGGGGGRRLLQSRGSARVVTIGCQPVSCAAGGAGGRAPVPPQCPGRQPHRGGPPVFRGCAAVARSDEDAASLAAGAASLVRGRLRVNADAGFGQFVLAPNLHRLFRSIPNWKLNLLFGSVRATWWPMGSTWRSVSASRNCPR